MGRNSQDIVRLADQAYLSIREEILARPPAAGRAAVATPSRARAQHECGAGGRCAAPTGRGRARGKPISSRHAGARAHRERRQGALRASRSARVSVGPPLRAARHAPQRQALRRHAEQVDVLFNRLATSDNDPDFKFVVNSHHVQLHMMIAEHASSRLLRDMIDRNHVLILNWLFDVTGRRTAAARRLPCAACRCAGVGRSGQGRRRDARPRSIRTERDFESHSRAGCVRMARTARTRVECSDMTR